MFILPFAPSKAFRLFLTIFFSLVEVNGVSLFFCLLCLQYPISLSPSGNFILYGSEYCDTFLLFTSSLVPGLSLAKYCSFKREYCVPVLGYLSSHIVRCLASAPTEVENNCVLLSVFTWPVSNIILFVCMAVLTEENVHVQIRTENCKLS